MFTLVHASSGQCTSVRDYSHPDNRSGSQSGEMCQSSPLALSWGSRVRGREREPVTQLFSQTCMRGDPLNCVFLLMLDLFLCPSLITAAFFSLCVAGLLLDHILALRSRKSQNKMNMSPSIA